MRYWVAEAAKQARVAADRKMVHVAAQASMDQSSIYRFENHHVFPDRIDLTIAAYAADLDIEPWDIWEQALKMWRESGDQASVGDLQGRRPTSDEPAVRTSGGLPAPPPLPRVRKPTAPRKRAQRKKRAS